MLCMMSTVALDDAALCSLVASTNIHNFQSAWVCDSSGTATSNYCTWPGITCDGGNNIVELDITPSFESGVTGTCTGLYLLKCLSIIL